MRYINSSAKHYNWKSSNKWSLWRWQVQCVWTSSFISAVNACKVDRFAYSSMVFIYTGITAKTSILNQNRPDILPVMQTRKKTIVLSNMRERRTKIDSSQDSEEIIQTNPVVFKYLHYPIAVVSFEIKPGVCTLINLYSVWFEKLNNNCTNLV